jgi:hypothetical protein
MKLEPISKSEPFKPICQMVTGRSAVPSDFSDSDLDLFEQIVLEMPDKWLQARLADLCWVRRRKYQQAISAIDAYRELPLDAETWTEDGNQCWTRCLRLIVSLGSATRSRLDDVEQRLLSVLDTAERKDIIFALGVAELLLGCSLAKQHSDRIGQKLESWAQMLADEHKYLYARRYFAAAINWWAQAKDERKVWELTARMAESFREEAKQHPSQAVAVGLFECALQTYRDIPQVERNIRNADERIKDLRREIATAGRAALKEMKRISVQIDTSEFAERARTAVRGKESHEAFRAFANLLPGARLTELRDQAIDKATDYPVSSLFPMTHFAGDGRVVAKRSALGSAEPDAEEALRREMVSLHQLHISLHVQGAILPAAEILSLEHRLTEQDFVWLTHESPVIPRGREFLWGKGLFRGYDSDYAEALHLLVPQIEHLVRMQLKAAGAITTTIDPDGIENEIGLSALVKLPQMTECFGDDLSFELTALYCDPAGPNLRNQVAHGLLDFGSASSIYSIYAWWLAFKLMFNPFWAARRARESPSHDSPPE